MTLGKDGVGEKNTYSTLFGENQNKTKKVWLFNVNLNSK